MKMHFCHSLIIAISCTLAISGPFPFEPYSEGAYNLHAKITKKENTGKSGKQDKPDKKDKEKDALETDEKKAEWIERTLEYGIQEERINAINKITKIKNNAIKTKLALKIIALMKDETDTEVLAKAFSLLGEIKEKSSIPLLTETIDHPSEEVRIAAVYALKNQNAISAKEKMIQKLKEQKLENNSNFIAALISALGEFKAVELVPFAKEALMDNKTDRAVKENLILFLGKVQAKDAGDILLKLYTDEDEDTTIRAFAVNAMAQIGLINAAPTIKRVIKTIESYDFKKRQQYHTLAIYSIAALAKLGDTDAIPKLIGALRSNNPEIRLKVISLIKDFKDKRTIDILQYKMKYDQNSKVRAAAKKALKEFGIDVKDDAK